LSDDAARDVGPEEARVLKLLAQYEAEHAAGRPTGRPWRPVDLAPVLDGSSKPLRPTVGRRSDGRPLLYAGKVHAVASETEGGKTMLALALASQELAAGRAVLYLDFEDSAESVVGRLRGLAVAPEVIRDRFAYLSPSEPIGGAGNADDLADVLGDLRPSLAVIDGVTEAMELHGLDPLRNHEIARFGRLLTRQIAVRGPATLMLDHVVKDREGRGRYALGGVHKLNGIDGASLLLENRTPFGIGTTGRSSVLIAKDRPGQLRRDALASRGLHWWADLVVESYDESFMEVTLSAPQSQSDQPFRPTVLMARVSEALANSAEPLAVRGVQDRVTGKQDVVRKALACLVDEGYVTTKSGPRGATLHTLVKPFTEGGE
jgi:hypothetical protein